MPNASKLFKIGQQMVEAKNLAQALQVRDALVAEGKLAKGATVVEHEAPAALGKVKMAPAVAMPAMVNTSPMDALRGLNQAYQEHIVQPIGNALKSTLTPDIAVGGTTYGTASPVSNTILETAADPVNYIPGGAGMAIGGAEAVAGFADGGIVPDHANVAHSVQNEPNVRNSVQPVEIYDMSGPTPVLGSIDPSEVQAAIQSGKFHLPVNRKVNVVSPDGQIGTIDASEAADAFNSGFTYASEDKAKYGNRTLAAAALGAANSATLGAFGPVLGQAGKLLGADQQDLNKLEQENPEAYAVGQVGGLFTPGGGAKILQAAGEAGAAALGLGMAVSPMGRVGSAATKAAIENMVFSGTDELSKTFMGKPEQSLESALINVGLSGAIGGGLGGIFGAVPELWRMGAGKKIESMLDGIKLATEGKPTAELGKLQIMAAPEIEAALSSSPIARTRFQELMQSDTMSGRSVQQQYDNFVTSLDDVATRVLGRTADDVAELSAAKTGESLKEALNKSISSRYEPIAKSYDDIERKFGTAAVQPQSRDAATERIQQLIVDEGLLKSKAAAPLLKIATEALEDLPKQATAQDLRLLMQNLKAANPFGKEGYQIAKKVAGNIQEAMDDTLALAADGAGLGAQFRSTQSEYRQLRSVMEDLNDYLHAGKVRGSESFVKSIKDMDPETVAKRLSQSKVNLTDVLEKNFPEVATQVKQYQYDTLIDKARVGDRIDIKKLVKQIDALEPEAKAKLFTPEQLDNLSSVASLKERLPKNMNPSGTAKTIAGILGQPASVLAGGLLGGVSGGIGAALGAMGLKEGSAAVKLAMLRFLGSTEKTNAAAFKQALGMAKAVERGEALVDKKVKQVFTGGGDKVAAPNTEKLKDAVDAISEDPSKLLGVGADLGHYLPDQAAALGMATVRNIRYLSSLRPSTAPLSPLDHVRKVSDADEAKYDRALQIAEQPLLILDAVRSGRLTMADMQHMQQMYPAMYANLQMKLQEEMIEAKAKAQSIPYATQISLSAFLSQPLVSSLQPQAIQAAQPVSMQQPADKIRNSGKIQKIGESYMTPGQSRQQDRQGRH